MSWRKCTEEGRGKKMEKRKEGREGSVKGMKKVEKERQISYK